jgi:hypothetical protein
MAETEKLTEEEREFLRCSWADYDDVGFDEATKMKALGVIDSLEAKHAKARQRIAELEAQVVAAETVSRAEYDAMVKQRDTLRQERNTAIEERDAERLRARELCEALKDARDAMSEHVDRASLDQAIDDIEEELLLNEEPQ